MKLKSATEFKENQKVQLLSEGELCPFLICTAVFTVSVALSKDATSYSDLLVTKAIMSIPLRPITNKWFLGIMS